MRLEEALQIGRQSAGARERQILLLCSFTPLHLQSYLKAYMRLRFPEDSIRVRVGLYGDLGGNLERALDQTAEGAMVVLEWTDLDQRLGFRSSGGWRTQIVDDIVMKANEKCAGLSKKLEALAQKIPLTLIPPTLPLPPMAHCLPVQAGKCELHLNSLLGDFLLKVSQCAGIRLLSASHLANISPPHMRYDAKMDLATGFPYALPHADALARLGVNCLFPPEPKKGLISDLDQTLWKGILGEIGVDGVSWSIEEKSQIHALYQQLLDSLAESGVLLAFASKNDPQLVNAALQRNDLLVRPDTIFPVEAGWGAKSDAVARILKAWNVAANDVVFVDDSPMELSEVSERFPQIECLLFTPSDPVGALTLLCRLRDLFGRAEIREEDRLRLASLRNAAEWNGGNAVAKSKDFLTRLRARVTFQAADINHKRALELINKTNQFNLNGVRFTEVELHARLTHSGSFLTTVSYEDRFGPLGRIAVLGGYFREGCCIVDIFVMSCRAFSRQIEFQIMQRLFEKTASEKIRLLFRPTERNGPMQTFLGQFVSLQNTAAREIEVSAAAFGKACPKLYHEVIDTWTMQPSEKS